MNLQQRPSNCNWIVPQAAAMRKRLIRAYTFGVSDIEQAVRIKVQVLQMGWAELTRAVAEEDAKDAEALRQWSPLINSYEVCNEQ